MHALPYGFPCPRCVDSAHAWEFSRPFVSEAPCSSLRHTTRDTPPNLLSVLLQVSLYGMKFVRGGRAKPSILIAIHETRLLKIICGYIGA